MYKVLYLVSFSYEIILIGLWNEFQEKQVVPAPWKTQKRAEESTNGENIISRTKSIEFDYNQNEEATTYRHRTVSKLIDCINGHPESGQHPLSFMHYNF